MAVRLEEQLLVAVSKGDISRVNDLLSKKPNVDYKNESGQFPLLVASQKGHKDIVQRLVDEGADVNMCGIRKITSLSLASEYGYHDVVKILIEKGAKVDHRLEDGRTPLMIACRHGHIKTVEVFLSKKADLDIHFGLIQEIPIMIACQYGHVDVIEALLPYFMPHVVDAKNHGYTLLAIGSICNHVKVVDTLLQKGAKVDLRCSNGFTALHLASICGHTKVVEKLLQRGANVDLRNRNGSSALILAIENNRTNVVRVLLRYNAEVDLHLHNSRKTALMIACEKGASKLVKLLLNAEPREISKTEISEEDTHGQKRSCSADVNIQAVGGYTALSFACESGRDDIVKTLLKHGANVNPESNECESPLLLATKKGYTNVVQVLLDNGAYINPLLPVFKLDYDNDRFPLPLIAATALDHTDIVKLLLKHNAYVDVVFGKNQFVTSLILAIFSGNFEVVKTLVENGANIQFLSTPLRSYYLQVDVTRNFSCVDVANAMANKKIMEFLQLKISETRDKLTTTTESGCEISTGESCIHAISTVPELDSATGPLSKKSADVDGISPNIAISISHMVQSEYVHIVQSVLKEFQNTDVSELLLQNDQNLSEMLPKEVRPTIENAFDFAPLSSSAVGKEPLINDTFRLLLSVAPKWENIGILLAIDDGDLCSIKADNKQVLDCLREMLRLWLKGVDPPPTWKDLAEAVGHLGEAKLAKEIREKYITM